MELFASYMDDPHFHEVSLPIIMDTFDYQEFKPEIDIVDIIEINFKMRF